MQERSCEECGNNENLKQGWTNSLYCSESCELSHVSSVHGSMPGGSLPRQNWVPSHIAREISNRWKDS